MLGPVVGAAVSACVAVSLNLHSWQYWLHPETSAGIDVSWPGILQLGATWSQKTFSGSGQCLSIHVHAVPTGSPLHVSSQDDGAALPHVPGGVRVAGTSAISAPMLCEALRHIPQLSYVFLPTELCVCVYVMQPFTYRPPE